MLRSSSRIPTAPRSALFQLRALEDRTVPAVVASFANRTLSVTGDSAANDIVVATRAIDIFTAEVFVTANGVEVPIARGNPVTTDFDTFRAVVVNAGGGNDSVLIENSVLPLVGQTATLSGGAGDDTLTYLGFNAGIYLGGSGNDTINSGRGEDTIDGGSGDDLIVRPASSRSDRIDGGAGYDTVRALGLDTFMGGPANDNFTLSANGTRANLATTSGSGGTFVADIGTVETIDIRPGAGNDGVFVGDLTGVASLRDVTVFGGDGNDRIDASSQANARISIHADGGAGDDVILGGAGRDVLSGGDGDDTLSGGAGADVLLGGNGNDRLDGGADGKRDILIGGAGDDTFVSGSRREQTILDFGFGDDILTP